MNTHHTLINKVSLLVALTLVVSWSQLHAAAPLTTAVQTTAALSTASIDDKLFNDIGPFDDQATAVAIQSDNKLVVAGSSDANNDSNLVVVRYTTAGRLDPSFSGDGIVLTDLGGNDRAAAIAIQADGKIVVAGSSDAGGSTDFALARYTVSGNLDSTFGSAGKLTTDFFGGDDQALALARQSDGKLIAAGFAHRDGATGFAVGRYRNGAFEVAGAVYLPLVRKGP